MQRSHLPHGVAILLLASACTDGSDPSFDKATPADDTGTPAITEDWRASCARMEAAGFADVASFNPGTHADAPLRLLMATESFSKTVSGREKRAFYLKSAESRTSLKGARWLYPLKAFNHQ